MTAVTRIEAAITRFPFLKTYISGYDTVKKQFILEFLPVSPGLFFLTNYFENETNHCSLYFFDKYGLPVKVEVKKNKTVERYVLENETYGATLIHYIVRQTSGKIQVYIPSPEYSNLSSQMSILLKEERQKAKEDLEKTLAGLYKKEECPTGNPGVDEASRNYFEIDREMYPNDYDGR